MSTIKKVTTPSKFVGQAQLNWCPECGHAMEDTQIKMKDGITVSGKKCKFCHYIHNPNFKQS